VLRMLCAEGDTSRAYCWWRAHCATSLCWSMLV